jgi:uncharacterized protein
VTDVTTESVDATGQSAAAQPPFERWLEAARPKAKLWRVIIGAIIVLAIWAAWTVAVLLVGGFAVLASSNGEADIREVFSDLADGATPVGIMIVLTTFLGFWLGVWLAVRMMHGQNFWSLVSPERRIRWRDFGIGAGMIAGYLLVGLAWSMLLGVEGAFRSNLSLIEWMAILGPMCLLIFFQTSGEELFFRGYLTQQLGARFRNPLIWGLLPSLAFGWIHYANGSFPEYSAYYVVSATLFALIATVTVWRTGSLSMAMGMHAANNFASFMVAGPSDTMNSTQLWLWSVDDIMKSAPWDMMMLALLLAFVLSPWAPMPRRQLVAFRKEMRAAP